MSPNVIELNRIIYVFGGTTTKVHKLDLTATPLQWNEFGDILSLFERASSYIATYN